MICPYRNIRVGTLYLPAGGDRFASRKAWRLGYRCQRLSPRDRACEKVFRLQRKLGSEQGLEAGLQRPKGMWSRTFARHEERYWELEDECSYTMDMHLIAAVARLLRRCG